MPLSGYTFLIISAAVLLSGQVNAQDHDEGTDQDSLSEYIERKHGLDQELINGIQFYQRNVQFRGDPYFPEDKLYPGTVTVKGTVYDDVQLKYNCYFQDIILQYTNLDGNDNLLILNNEHIDSFRLGTCCFTRKSFMAGDPLYYQVFSFGPVTLYVHWEKSSRRLNYFYQNYTSEYTRLFRHYFVANAGQIRPLTGKMAFLSVLPDSLKKEAKKYFKKQRLSLRSAGPSDLQQLVDFLTGRYPEIAAN
jgi:hypothetical protein